MARLRVREALIREIKKVKPARVAVLLSGGIDSLAVALAAMHAGKRVSTYTVALEGRESTDLKSARRRSEIFRWPHTTVRLPLDLESLKAGLRDARDFGAVLKTDYECSWPIMLAMDAVEEPAILTGHFADAPYALTKHAMIHYVRKGKLDEMREFAWRNRHDMDQWSILSGYAKHIGKTIHRPFCSLAFYKMFKGTTWDEINRPRQKQPILDAFPASFARVKVRNHTNLQLGDSGIAKHFEILLGSDWDVRGAKTVTTIYNDLTTGAIK